MGLAFGNLMGAASGAVAGFGKEQSLKKFLSTLDSFGVQITSRFEVNFSGFPQATFFITNISTPGTKQNVTQLYFDGKMVEIPLNYEYEHDFTMTVINDASGYIYTGMMNFLMNDSGTAFTNNGYTMTIKAIGDDNKKGSVIKLNGVRIKTCSGLNFQYEGGNVSTFELGCSAIDVNVTPGALKKASGIAGAIGRLIR